MADTVEIKGVAAYGAALQQAVEALRRERVMERLWSLDHTLWKPDPAEIANRLGWLRLPQTMAREEARLIAVRRELVVEGFSHVLLLGMGGSSLAPEVFQKTFGGGAGTLELSILDSTDPGEVLRAAQGHDPNHTLYIVSTKSGGTVETNSFFKFFWNHAAARLGEALTGNHFMAITDPGSGLAVLAERFGFREILLNDPNIGGRFSALSFFGLAPAALVGVDLKRLLERAALTARACGPTEAANPGMALGVTIGEMAKQGRDKLTFILSPGLASFGDWVEQLIAESTGKEGRGIVPVVGEAPGAPEVYGPDRLFVGITLPDDTASFKTLADLEGAGHPVIRIPLLDPYDLGGQFFLWEMATAVAGWCLAINPFDQPDVESAKVQAKKMVAEYQATGALPAERPTIATGLMSVYGAVDGRSPEEALEAVLAACKPGDYVALQAYLTPSPENERLLAFLRERIRSKTRLAVTVGWGPRFLHSTGQLHKGDAGRGLMIQFTADSAEDAAIPDAAGEEGSSMTFGLLEAAQAMGDRRALVAAGRRVIRFHLGADVATGLAELMP